VFTQSVVWGINAFDQWGVELGKKVASQLAPAVSKPDTESSATAAVVALLKHLAKWRDGT
jgi:glucose-6-phosphate isomerase